MRAERDDVRLAGDSGTCVSCGLRLLFPRDKKVAVVLGVYEGLRGRVVEPGVGKIGFRIDGFCVVCLENKDCE